MQERKEIPFIENVRNILYKKGKGWFVSLHDLMRNIFNSTIVFKSNTNVPSPIEWECVEIDD